MIRFVIPLLLLNGLLYSSVGCAPAQSVKPQQQGDTVVHVFGRRILVPIGADEPYMNMGINELRNASDPRPNRINAPGYHRQVTFSKVRLYGVVGGKETADAFYSSMCKDYGDKEYILKECGETEYGKYGILEYRLGPDYTELGRFQLIWFTPNEDYALEVLYTVDPEVYEKLGGMTELKRFAERVRLLPD